ncbi:molybdopterin adenylyltransferase [Chengkuizengella axinellae]|uniref:Molybdenum cofactor biosynthesis protein B n=1 Tax=Chengkuizengella axinellae TaxID=3064388 RepID=A0ABT9J4U5_9BACL|nr:molybdopterin adenylyltransferase [Chengkuizengella sp. 2205SS18-9]MDP5276642.1 molybdopterin adenylyltransferase [Chengkuizengella sp. 2205SS18-9]
MRWKVAILTASDKGSRGEREDVSAQVIRELIEEEINGDVKMYKIVPDEQHHIEDALIEMADKHQVDLILTTGGTGFAPRDVTPEATLKVVEKQVPGFTEVMRSASVLKTRRAMLSRAVSGIRGTTLIINLPGSPKGVHENLQVIIDQLPHALAILKGVEGEHKS